MAGRQLGKYKQALRILSMLELLRGSHTGIEVRHLAQEFEITERQVRRDLEAIELAGYEIQFAHDDGQHARARLADPPLRSVRLTLRERYALLAARRAFDVLQGTPFHDDINAIYAKITATLPPENRHDLERLADRLVFLPDGGTKAYRKKQNVLDGLLTGVLRRLRVDYVYVRGDGKKRSGLLEPYAMVVYRQGIYIVGRPASGEADAGNGMLRVYAAERFSRAVHVRGETFEVPKTFSADAFFHGVFGIFGGGTENNTRVVVELSSEVRGLVEGRIWHPGQKIQKLGNGKLRLSFEVPDTTQVVPWVLSWGDHAKLISPPSLAERIENVVRRMAATERGQRLSDLPPPLGV